MRIRFSIEALTPIAHFDTRTGVNNPTNIRLFMTQPAMLNGRLVYVPHVSENALRTVLFRRPLADHLVAELGIGPGELPRPIVNLLYAGGSMGGGRTPGDETVLGHRIKRLYPSLDLLGGAVDTFIMPRSRLRLCAWIVAEEYLPAIRDIFPELEGTAAACSAHDLIGEETRTRGIGDEAQGNQMLYSYEALAAGSRIAVELTVDPAAPAATVSAIGRALAEWDGFVGGQGRQGRGRGRIEWLDVEPASASYDEHLVEHGAAMAAGLRDGTLGTERVLCAAAA